MTDKVTELLAGKDPAESYATKAVESQKKKATEEFNKAMDTVASCHTALKNAVAIAMEKKAAISEIEKIDLALLAAAMGV